VLLALFILVTASTNACDTSLQLSGSTLAKVDVMQIARSDDLMDDFDV